MRRRTDGRSQVRRCRPLAADFSAGTLMGKRYVDADGKYELLCVKPGKGSLSVDGVALVVKDAKPLPPPTDPGILPQALQGPAHR